VKRMNHKKAVSFIFCFVSSTFCISNFEFKLPTKIFESAATDPGTRATILPAMFRGSRRRFTCHHTVDHGGASNEQRQQEAKIADK
jgi:hypothetical protein